MKPPVLSVPGIDLRGVVCSLPARRLLNTDFAPRFDVAEVQEVSAITGVENRHWAAPAQTAADLCEVAAYRLLDQLDWPAESVDALLLVTQTPDQRMPATACLLHGRLGLASHCAAFDVALGCSGYVYGLWLAATMIAGGCRRVLLLAGDTSSRLIDPADRATALLFGDAGSATALEWQKDVPPAHFVLGTDGRGAAHLSIEAGGYRSTPASRDTLFMDGGEVFGFTLRTVPHLVRDTLAQAGRDVGSVDVFAFHQANRLMLRHIGKKLGVAPNRMPINIERYGNTSSASIPLLLATDLAARLAAGPAAILMAGFGVGLSWGAVSMDTRGLACAEAITA